MVEETVKNEVAEETAVSAVPFRDDKKKKPKKPSNPMARRENLVGWLFCSPIIVGILVFTALPVILSLISMFYNWKGGSTFVTDAPMIGFENFKKVFADPERKYLISLKNMLLFAIQVPIGLFIGMFLGIAMNRAMKGVQTFRILYYLPCVMSVVAVTLVFQKLFNMDGYINNLTGSKVDWLDTKAGMAFTVNLMMIWKGVGYTALMYVAGLQSVSTDQLEAAKIDGANGWTIFYKITLPALYPITFYLLVTGIMGGLQVFNEPFILATKEHGTDFNAITPISYVYWARRGENYGASAVGAWFLALIILIVTMIQMYFDNKRDKEA